jgi:hypothetical protein
MYLIASGGFVNVFLRSINPVSLEYFAMVESAGGSSSSAIAIMAYQNLSGIFIQV